MTPEEVKTNQRIFEAGGSLACGGVFGLLLGMAESSPDARANPTGYVYLLWWLFVSVACYTNTCYLLDRYAERKGWRVRANWALIAVIPTTLLFVAGIVPSLTRRQSFYPPDWGADEVIRYAMLLVVLSVPMLMIMFGAWSLGFVMRLVSGKTPRHKVVP